MARIRSIHPGLWTDEEFVSCSPIARLLLIGLWNEADDQGVFEWKPVSLKMRLLPMDNVDVDELLGELQSVNAVGKFQMGEKWYGACRNFRKYQRPKSPSAVHPLPPDLRNYVGLGEEISEAVPQKGEKAAQMEDEGEGEGGKEKTPQPPEGEGDTISSQDVRKAFDAFNAVAQSQGLPKARDLTPERKRRLRARLAASGGLPTWYEALDHVKASAFLTGKTDRAFRADLDFLCQAKSFQRVIEGYYGECRAPPQQQEGVRIRIGTPQWDAWIEHMERRGEKTSFIKRIGEFKAVSEWPPKEQAA